MKVHLTKASDWDFEKDDIEVTTLEDIIKLMNDYAIEYSDGSLHPCSLIVDLNEKTNTLNVKIYDDWVE